MDIKKSIDNVSDGLDKVRPLMDELTSMRSRMCSVFGDDVMEFILIDDDPVYQDIFEKILYKEAKLADVEVKLKTIRTLVGIETLPHRELDNTVMFIDICMNDLSGPEIVSMLGLGSSSKVFYVSASSSFDEEVQLEIDSSGIDLIEKDHELIRLKIREMLAVGCLNRG